MKYDAFISYRHSETDMYVAKKVHKGLETYKVPRSVKKAGGKQSIKRVFRDQEELPIGSNLGDNISDALADSEFLVVICSPRLIKSEWCQKEINTFISMHDREHALAVLVEGEPNESFPPELLTDQFGNKVEPLAADVRGKSKREIRRKLRTEIVRLAAPILHCSYDDLRQRNRERKLKKIIASVAAIGVVIAGLGIGFGVYNAKMAAQIEENYVAKQVNQSKYLAETSLGLFEKGDRRTAALVAAAALPDKDNERPYVAEAEYALSKALYAYANGEDTELDRQFHHDLPVMSISYSKDAEYLVSIDSGNSVYVWNMASGKRVLKVEPGISSMGLQLQTVDANVVGDELIIVCETGIKTFSLSGKSTGEYSVDYLVNAKFSEDLNRLAYTTLDKLEVFDISEKKVIAQLERTNDYFTGEPAFSDDGRYVSIAHSRRSESQGQVSVLDIQTGNTKRFDTKLNYIMGISNGENGEIYAISTDFDEFSFGRSVDNKVPRALEKFSMQADRAVWDIDITNNATDALEGYTKVTYRNYDDASGETHRELVVLTNKRVCTYDAESAQELARVDFSDNIYGFTVSKVKSLGYMGENSGNINIVDLTTGYNYSMYRLETGIPISDMLIHSGVIAIRTASSLDVTLLCGHKGDTYFELGNLDTSVYDMWFSPSDKVFVASAFGSVSGDLSSFSFFDSRTLELISQYEYIGERMVTFSDFVTDDKFIVIDARANGVIIDINTGNATPLNLEEAADIISLKCVFSPSRKKLILYSIGNIIELNTETLECKNIFSSYDSRIQDVCATDDGTIIVADSEKGLLKIDFEGTMTAIDNDKFAFSKGSTEKHIIKMSNDGKLMALCCMDSRMRIVNADTYELSAELPFLCNSRKFLEFSEDSSMVYMQGDDYVLRIYDVAGKKYVYEALEQNYNYEHVYETENEICFSGLSEMRVLDKKSKAVKAVVDRGKLFIEESGTILASNKSLIYGFRYSPYEKLLENLTKSFPDEELSEAERAKYYVD